MKIPCHLLSALVLLCLHLCCSPTYAKENPAPLKVFVFAGQSNMAGLRSNAGELKDSSLAGPQENLSFFNGDWVPLAPGSTQNTPAGVAEGERGRRAREGFGPEISFAYRVSQALGEPVGIIKLAQGRTSLQRHWLPGRPGGLYEQLSQIVKAASGRRPIEVVSMLWMQGETDAKAPAEAKAYAGNLRTLVETARRDFGNPRMSFVAGRINLPDPADPASMQMVREALAGRELSDYAWIDCDDLPTVSDRLHFDTQGIEEMGKRMANAFLRLHSADAQSEGGDPAD